MNDMLFGFILGIFAMVLKDIINYFWGLGTRPVELSPDEPLWSEETKVTVEHDEESFTVTAEKKP